MARGDDEFADFVRASSARLTHAAFLLTGDRHQAEDAAQTAFTRTYAAWSRVRHKDAYGYARTVLMNHVIDGWRRPIREYATEEMPERPDRVDVDQAVTQREWLTAVLKTLTARERAVVVLRHFFDLPEADVARELGVSLGTVKSTNSRALAKLRIEAGTEDTLIGGSGR
ncbi:MULTISPECIES: SigE family RNA polymerase sigma factor [unclassified Amycolatopsis]|uniref:SigE family RNA polymerase sigma factor n=1 Tax=unclassified Amycolatopsis TaxID=2618356 RepID=UPI002E1295B7|nr:MULTISPECIES: SigE family RNA polymerase sigma factor [unclassified Amycolatopsis]WSJ75453.1 SigE family RNA polymerase sigma factor [Amycolatopsis sp. NBC_01307]WSK80887.1 SigE family RNA polymerase sigma factor [Amycolatopsis sp. NBC_01286]